jgi:hypothetical protein
LEGSKIESNKSFAVHSSLEEAFIWCFTSSFGTIAALWQYIYKVVSAAGYST